jgi:predicted DNA-binding protein (MmcQ/YjbR family)
MDIEAIRKYCLSMPHATEDIQWGNNLLFRIRKKMFAVVSLDQTPPGVSFKCTPEEFAELMEREGIIPARTWREITGCCSKALMFSRALN